MGKALSSNNVKVNEQGFVSHEKYAEISDEELVTHIRNGTTRLFEVIMRRYNQRLYRIVKSYVTGEEEVKDILQTAYIKAYENLGQFRGDARFGTWMTRIAINEALKAAKQQKRYSDLHTVQPDGYPGNTHRSDAAGPEKQAIRADLKKLLEEAVESLDPIYRSVYMMREIEQMNTRETAECLEITEENVKVRLHRARQMLRGELEQRVTDKEIFDFKGARCDALVKSVMAGIA